MTRGNISYSLQSDVASRVEGGSLIYIRYGSECSNVRFLDIHLLLRLWYSAMVFASAAW